MSVNDPLPWIPRLTRVVRDAVAAGVPVIGHCLGGQLLSKALEGEVSLNAVKEIGWGEVTVAQTAVAREWFGETRGFMSFHWHGETFSIPRGAELIASSRYCLNQAFAFGKHLGLQCHIEMTPQMVKAWCRSGADEIRSATSSAVQTPAVIQENLGTRIEALNAVAGRLYDRWLEGFN